MHAQSKEKPANNAWKEENLRLLAVVAVFFFPSHSWGLSGGPPGGRTGSVTGRVVGFGCRPKPLPLGFCVLAEYYTSDSGSALCWHVACNAVAYVCVTAAIARTPCMCCWRCVCGGGCQLCTCASLHSWQGCCCTGIECRHTRQVWPPHERGLKKTHSQLTPHAHPGSLAAPNSSITVASRRQLSSQ